MEPGPFLWLSHPSLLLSLLPFHPFFSLLLFPSFHLCPFPIFRGLSLQDPALKCGSSMTPPAGPSGARPTNGSGEFWVENHTPLVPWLIYMHCDPCCSSVMPVWCFSEKKWRYGLESAKKVYRCDIPSHTHVNNQLFAPNLITDASIICIRAFSVWKSVYPLDLIETGLSAYGFSLSFCPSVFMSVTLVIHA